MAQREVTDGEIIRFAWAAEDRVRSGASCLAHRQLAPRGEIYLTRARPRTWTLVAVRWTPLQGGWLRAAEDVYDFSDGDAAWRAAIGWNGKGEPQGFARHRRRA